MCSVAPPASRTTAMTLSSAWRNWTAKSGLTMCASLSQRDLAGDVEHTTSGHLREDAVRVAARLREMRRVDDLVTHVQPPPVRGRCRRERFGCKGSAGAPQARGAGQASAARRRRSATAHHSGDSGTRSMKRASSPAASASWRAAKIAWRVGSRVGGKSRERGEREATVAMRGLELEPGGRRSRRSLRGATPAMRSQP